MKPLVKTLEKLTLCLAVICVASIMLIVSYDALSRYVFHAPLPWAFELITYYLLIAATYLAVSETFREGDHINIDLFRTMMSRQFRARVDIVWSLLAAVIFAIITYGAFEKMLGAWRGNEFLPGYITWPAWASYLPIAVSFLLLTLRLILHAVTLFIHGQDDEVIEHFEAEIEEHHE